MGSDFWAAFQQAQKDDLKAGPLIQYLTTGRGPTGSDYNALRGDAQDYAMDQAGVLLHRLNPPGVEGPVLYVPDGPYTGPALDAIVPKRTLT